MDDEVHNHRREEDYSENHSQSYPQLLSYHLSPFLWEFFIGDKSFRRFIQGGPEERRKMHSVRCESLCVPEERGLGCLFAIDE